MMNTTINGNVSSNFSENVLDCLDFDSVHLMCLDGYDTKPFKMTPVKALSVFGIAVLIIIALAGNILVCAAFCYYRRLRTVTNYFIVSLAISDVMVAGLSMPLWLSYEATGWENLPKWMDFLTLVSCWEMFDVLAGVSSITNLTAISLDRFFSIIAPLRHRTRMTPIVALIMIIFCWVYSLIIALCYLVHNNLYPAFNSSFGFFLPLMVVLFCYISIYIKFRLRSSRQGSLDGDWNLEKTLLIVTGLFVVCWLPFHMFTLLYTYCHSCPFNHNSVGHINGFLKWMHYLNSCCNPIVYGFFNINFKTAFWAMLHRCIGSKYADMDLVALSRDTSSSQNGTFLRHLKSLRRKLSWKRDVEESTVTNGELNDNSISVAMLAIHLKSSAQASEYRNGTEYRENGSPLLGMSSSRSSSKASEDRGLLSDDQSVLYECAYQEANQEANTKSLESSPSDSCKSNNVTASTESSKEINDLVYEQPTLTVATRSSKLSESSDEVEAFGEDSRPLFGGKDQLKSSTNGLRPHRKLGRVPEIFARRNESNYARSPGEKRTNKKPVRADEMKNSFTDLDADIYNSAESLQQIEDLKCDAPAKAEQYSLAASEMEVTVAVECLEGEQFLDSKESVV